MSTVNLSLPDALRAFVDEQVAKGDYGTSGDYLCDLIRKERDRDGLRSALLEGAESEPGPTADEAWFAGLRARLDRPAAE